MNVSELRQQLQDMEENGQGDMEVMFSYNYGDHWRTQVASEIRAVQEDTVKYSDYHNMHKLVDYDEDRDEEEDTKQVVIIN